MESRGLLDVDGRSRRVPVSRLLFLRRMAVSKPGSCDFLVVLSYCEVIYAGKVWSGERLDRACDI